MKYLDDSTLEAVAEAICGSGQGAGGGRAYNTLAPYRSMSEIHALFGRAGVEPHGQSSTRKWFALECLRDLNDPFTFDGGDVVPLGIEKVLLRLAEPREYAGSPVTARLVADHLNTILATEGLEVVFEGVRPVLHEREPGLPPERPPSFVELSPPDFALLAPDNPRLAEVLRNRWNEAQLCMGSGAHLSALVMMGSILEGMLLARAEMNKEEAYRTKACPRAREGKSLPLQKWRLESLIRVAHELGWLGADVKRFSHALRESRNLVHPYVEAQEAASPDADTCRICWEVVQAALSDLLAANGPAP